MKNVSNNLIFKCEFSNAQCSYSVSCKSVKHLIERIKTDEDKIVDSNFVIFNFTIDGCVNGFSSTCYSFDSLKTLLVAYFTYDYFVQKFATNILKGIIENGKNKS